MRNERGAVIIHVAIALIALLAFGAIVTDQGVMFVARRQAQTAADAGALAGALSLLADPSKTAEATLAAQTFASANTVWGQATANADILVSPLPFTCPASAGGGNSCIRVDVMRGVPDRNGSAHTNSMPTYMMRMVGLTSQGVRATATAQVAAGNAVQCIKPWIVADKWIDNDGTTHPPGGWDQYDTYSPPTDSYSPPGFKATGSGNDYGLQLVLKEGQTGTWSSGWTMQVDFGTSGSNAYRAEIAGCPTYVPTVGLYDGSIPCASKSDTPNPVKGCVSVKPGMANGPTQQGVADLIKLDSSATWNTSTNSVSGGCMATGSCANPTGANISPRIVPLAIFNTQAYYNEEAGNACSGGNCVAQVVNLLGFFVEGMCNDVYPTPATRPGYCGTNAQAGKAVVGRLTAYPGQTNSASGSAGPATFLKVTRLVR
jgi:Flp pilus assembly protein TadG